MAEALPSRKSAWTPASEAFSRAISTNVALTSRPVTVYPLRASAMDR
jgi:hypothetical protein